MYSTPTTTSTTYSVDVEKCVDSLEIAATEPSPTDLSSPSLSGETKASSVEPEEKKEPSNETAKVVENHRYSFA